jgi:BA14K-like protein
MSHRQLICLAAVVALGIVIISADAFAARGAARGGGAVNRGAVGARGGAVANRGAVGVRGGIAYRGSGYGGGVYRGGYYRPGVGLAAGAAVGGAIAASQYGGYGYGGYGYDNNYYGSNPGYAASYPTSGSQDASYCAQRFKSYDAGSGTYMGYDGQRHPCP